MTLTVKPKIPQAILKVDRDLYRLHKKIRLLYYVNPLNSRLERKQFISQVNKGKKYTPKFRYRPLEFDPMAMARELIHLDKKVDYGDFGTLYKRKIEEIHNQLMLLCSIGDVKKFSGYSMALYGIPKMGTVLDVNPLDVASLWLTAARNVEVRHIPAHSHDPHRRTAEKTLEREIRYYGFPATVQVKEQMSANAAAGETSVSIRVDGIYTDKEVEQLCHHEVGFHLVTTFNGRRQPLRLFEMGTAGYTKDQEGGAVWAEEESKAITRYRLGVLGARTVGVHLALEGADFFEVFQTMVDRYCFDQRDAFHICERVFRGGLFTKDSVYQIGFNAVRNHVRFGLADPYVFISGKMTIEEVPFVHHLIEQKVFYPPKYLPKFMEDVEWISTWKILSQSHNLFRRENFVKA